MIKCNGNMLSYLTRFRVEPVDICKDARSTADVRIFEGAD